MDILLQVCLVILTGFAAGAVNTIAGGGTLLVYPALLACGLPPVTANVTSLIGLTPGYVTGAYVYRDEIRAVKQLLPTLGVTTLVGAVAGAVVLLVTPGKVFENVVPYLVLISSILLTIQPWLKKKLARPGKGGTNQIRAVTIVSVLFGAFYGAYFSAGAGVLLLALLGATLNEGFQRINGLKNGLSLIIILAAVCIYIFSGHVNVLFTLVLLPSSGLGGVVGGVLARKLNANILRYSVCVLGFALFFYLLFN